MQKVNSLFYQRYRLLESFGRGGFSTVWKALDEKTGTTVAVKIFIKQDEEGVELCRQEYRRGHDLAHPHIVKAIFFDVEQNVPFLVMPFYQHGTAEALAGSMGEKELAKTMMQIASALEYLHKRTRPLIHNDVKPDNFLVSDEGDYLLSDFGISDRLQQKLTQTIAGQEEYERTSKPGVTPVAYRAPELFAMREQPKQSPSPASDVWALGASLYQLAHGEPPFSGQGGLAQRIGMGRGQAKLEDLLENLPANCSHAFKAWVNACLALEPGQRPTAKKLRQAAQQYLEKGLWPLPQSAASIYTSEGGATAESPAFVAGEGIQNRRPRRQSPVPIWAWGLGGVLIIAAIFALALTSEKSSCEELVAEGDRFFHESNFEEAKKSYRFASYDCPDSPGLAAKQKAAKVQARLQAFATTLPMSEGVAPVADSIAGRLRWGFYDTATASITVHLKYDSVAPFEGGLATVWEYDEPKIIDKTGAEQIQEMEEEDASAPIEAEDPETITNDSTEPITTPDPVPRPVDKVDFALSAEVAYVGQTIRFTDQSGPARNVASRQWDFGDRKKSNTHRKTAKHTYRSPGEYEVKLCVNKGNKCKKKQVTVIAPSRDFSKNNKVGYTEADRNSCLAKYGDPAWCEGSATVTFQPKTTLMLKDAILFGDIGGRVKLTLSDGNTRASVIRYVNRGRSRVNLEELDMELRPGKSYTLQISPLKNSDGHVPRLEKGCGTGSAQSNQLIVNYGQNAVLFEIGYAY